MSLPASLNFNGKEMNLLTFQQLEQQSRKNLIGIVNNLRDDLGADNLPKLTGQGPDMTIEWILNVQCAMCMGKGVRVTPADLAAWSAACHRSSNTT